MSQTHWLRGATAVLMSGLLLLLAAGCNEGKDFNPDELFSIEDYAQDTDYASSLLSMMNSWRVSLSSAKKQLDTNVEGLSFIEAVPPEWTSNDPSDTALLWYNPLLTEDQQWIDENWYYRSYQDASYEFIRLNQDAPNDAALNPSHVEFMRFEFQRNPYGVTFGLGDSVSVNYEGYENPSMLEGSATFYNTDVVQAATAPTDLASYASMVNSWHATIANVSPDPHNPQGEFAVTGNTVLIRADLLEQATLNVRITAAVRANGRGEAEIKVNGDTRAKLVFESFDTSFHGYYLLRSSGFKERLAF